jgi:hypothetical protein
MLTREQIDHFELFGFCLLPRALSSSTVDALRQEVLSTGERLFGALTPERAPFWFAAMSEATPTSASLIVDEGELWGSAQQLLGSNALPCPAEAGILFGDTFWHRDDPLGVRGVKLLAYLDPTPPGEGLLVLPLSHSKTTERALTRFIARSGGGIESHGDHTEAWLLRLPGVLVVPTPGDLVAIDLHVWHAYRGRGRRLLWNGEYVARPETAEERDIAREKFASCRHSHAAEGSVWADWVANRPRSPRRANAISRLRMFDAFGE